MISETLFFSRTKAMVIVLSLGSHSQTNIKTIFGGLNPHMPLLANACIYIYIHIIIYIYITYYPSHITNKNKSDIGHSASFVEMAAIPSLMSGGVGHCNSQAKHLDLTGINSSSAEIPTVLLWRFSWRHGIWNSMEQHPAFLWWFPEPEIHKKSCYNFQGLTSFR